MFLILQQYLVPHPTNTIDLATLGSTAVVSNHISVVLEIVHRGTPIRCKVIIGIMQGLRYDLVLSLIVITSHYVDVLVDLLNVQLQQTSSNPNTSLSMMTANDATQLTMRLLFEPEFQLIRTHSEARAVLTFLEEECDHPDLPFRRRSYPPS